MRKVGLILVVYFSFCGAMIMKAQAQRRIDSRNPLPGVQQDVEDLVDGQFEKLRRQRREYNYRHAVEEYRGLLEELIYMGQRTRNRDYDRARDYRHEEEYHRREQRRIYEEEQRIEEEGYRRQNRVSRDCYDCVVILPFTNTFGYHVELFLNGRVLRYSKGTMIPPGFGLNLPIPRDQDYVLEMKEYTDQGCLVYELEWTGKYWVKVN